MNKSLLFQVDKTSYRLLATGELVTVFEGDQEIITGLTHDEAFDWLARELGLDGSAFIPVTRTE